MAIEDKSPVKLGLSANLDVSVSTEIPSEASGRFLEALTDMLRPISERRGLKADLIRLQREDIAIEVVRKARERLELENRPMQTVPNKILVPLLEKASLEEHGSSLIDRWADLLANAVIKPESVHPRFIQILSELAPADADTLRAIALNGMGELAGLCCLEDAPLQFHPHCFLRELNDALAKCTAIDAQELVDRLYDLARRIYTSTPGVALIDVCTSEKHGDGCWDFGKEKIGPLGTDHVSKMQSVEILRSLGLAEEYKLEISHPLVDIWIYYVSITDLGVSFICACDRQVSEESSKMPSLFSISL